MTTAGGTSTTNYSYTSRPHPKRLGSRYKGGDTTDWVKCKTFVTGVFDLVGVHIDKRGVPMVLMAEGGRSRGSAVLALSKLEREAFWRLVDEQGGRPIAGGEPVFLPRGLRGMVKHLSGRPGEAASRQLPRLRLAGNNRQIVTLLKDLSKAERAPV